MKCEFRPKTASIIFALADHQRTAAQSSDF
jgi:hypothetical protein